MKVDGKVWVVTGAGSGMGRELVFELLRRGARVGAVDVRAEGLDATAGLANAGERLSTHVLDITDRAAVTALPDAVVAAHGAVDGLVNNAGIIQQFVPVADLDDAAIERVMNVNFYGTLHVTRAFLPLLMGRPEAHVANVSSMGGFFPFPGQTIYGASKAAVKLLTEGLYAELLDTRVRVSVIMPGAVDTAITANSGVDGPAMEEGSTRMTPADRAARIMLDGIERDRLHIYVGPDARLMSLAIKLAPRRAIRFVKDQMAKREVSGAAERIRQG
jgi:NAD(P)-dependent dehydrogenase (short-subunit alcohol dehydrogenase family)